MQVLVVTNPFGDRAKGDRITDPQQIEQILAGGHANDVVQSDHADMHAATPEEFDEINADTEEE